MEVDILKIILYTILILVSTSAGINLSPPFYENRPGDPGDIGFPGLPGPFGDEGSMGPKGLRGPKGERGSQGYDGLSGKPAVCGGLCTHTQKAETKEFSYNVANSKKVSKENPLTSCKQASHGTGKYWIRPSNPFLVYCDMDAGMTCLVVNKPDGFTIADNSISHGDKPFWLSERNFNLTKFYNDVTMDKLNWLNKQSSFVSQKVRYHCKNSQILPKGYLSVERALHFLSWNDEVIGPHRTEYGPYYYSIVPEKNGCQDSANHKRAWRHTDIILESKTHGLPITDFHIRDIRNEDQKLYIQLVQLCFG